MDTVTVGSWTWFGVHILLLRPACMHPSALLKVKENQIARSSLILHVLSFPHVSKTLFVYCYSVTSWSILVYNLDTFWSIYLPCYVSIYFHLQPIGQFWSAINHFLHTLPPVNFNLNSRCLLRTSGRTTMETA